MPTRSDSYEAAPSVIRFVGEDWIIICSADAPLEGQNEEASFSRRPGVPRRLLPGSTRILDEAQPAWWQEVRSVGAAIDFDNRRRRPTRNAERGKLRGRVQ